MRIIQLSDIHIGGEYDGKFNCRHTFDKTLEAIEAKLNPLHRKGSDSRGTVTPTFIVVTGDVYDGYATVDQYKEIDSLIRSKVSGVNEVIYMPGNHDNAKMMGEAFDFDPEEVDLFRTDEANIMVIPTHSGSVDVDKLMAEIVPGLATLDRRNDVPLLVFSHFPIGNVQHRFMHDIGGALTNGDKLAQCLQLLGVKDTFCGHFHAAGTTVLNNDYRIHVAPATQCQIDPWSKELVTVADYPGFSDIWVDRTGVTVEYNFVEM